MAHDDPLVELVEIIQAGDEYPEVYASMLFAYFDAKDEDDTPKMALALAKKALRQNAMKQGKGE